MTKLCPSCKEIRPNNQFSKRSGGSLQSYCKPCMRERWHVYALKKIYDLTPEQYESILQRQNAVCKICLQPEPSKKRLAIDHNHKTGKVRGLLCGDCNRGLGLFFDDVSYLRSAIEYLEQSNLA